MSKSLAQMRQARLGGRMCLMGDDVEFLEDGWLLDVPRNFPKLSNNEENLTGFGCVAFTNTSFPEPTFPIVSTFHMDLFGEVIPDCFIDQDGHTYLFQLYRRFGRSLRIPSRIQTLRSSTVFINLLILILLSSYQSQKGYKFSLLSRFFKEAALSAHTTMQAAKVANDSKLQSQLLITFDWCPTHMVCTVPSVLNIFEI